MCPCNLHWYQQTCIVSALEHCPWLLACLTHLLCIQAILVDAGDSHGETNPIQGGQGLEIPTLERVTPDLRHHTGVATNPQLTATDPHQAMVLLMVPPAEMRTAPLAQNSTAETPMRHPAGVHMHPLPGHLTRRQLINHHTAHDLLMHHHLGKRSSQPLHLAEGLSRAITPMQHCKGTRVNVS